VTISALESAFTEAEASLRLEGFDVASDADYQNLKRRVLNGELSFDDARRELRERYAKARENPA
jgi:hypothetical protein